MRAAKEEFSWIIRLGLKNDVEERAHYRLTILHVKAGAFAQARHQLGDDTARLPEVEFSRTTQSTCMNSCHTIVTISAIK